MGSTAERDQRQYLQRLLIAWLPRSSELGTQAPQAQTGKEDMSSKGNRRNLNSTRVGGHPDQDSENSNRSDKTDRIQADSGKPPGRMPLMNNRSNRETREHNKHDNSTERSHSIQQRSPPEEKR